jgi:hypothetical protein
MTRVATASYISSYRYDFAVDGGATGTITLHGPKLPSGALVTDAVVIVDTAPVGAGASIALTTGEGAGDIQAAAAISGAPWSTIGAKRASALTASTAPVRLTQDRAPGFVISGAALTAGKVRMVLTVMEVV